MATIWLTYAWKDNEQRDVDYIVQELTADGLTVKSDRWNIQAGKRLWEQIANFIQNPTECDAWVMYTTQNSLGSEPCKEEFAYALDRALRARGEAFPVMGLFPGPVDNELLPAGIRIRLYVSTTDLDWKERIKAAAEGRAPSIDRPTLESYFLQVHEDNSSGPRVYVIEVRPRAGTWAPFIAAIPAAEKDVVNPRISFGPRGRVPTSGMIVILASGVSDDGQWWGLPALSEATPTQSYYISCDALPGKLLFGVDGQLPQYTVEFSK